MMISFQVEESESNGSSLRLPKPDPANITVLTRNLPNKPILPWTHFDSPWLDKEENASEESKTQESQNSEQLTEHDNK
ncbi:MAG: hypothetical protein SAK29_30460 [Scytonema sp. PMC 1069.18]|nr:hypothetical protein [Scytonema sp. PMC 1069.18]MEC4879880.1 hypothetical protein [Scytonema sp. PMC 1070.18]